MILVKMKCKFFAFFLTQAIIFNCLFLNSSIDADENLVESEYEDDDDKDDRNAVHQKTENEPTTRISWLLQIALENLGVTVSSYIVRVRIF